MDKQDASAYGLAYSKTFAKCNTNFELGKTPLGIVIDWLDAKIKGIGISMGKELAITHLKGRKVHWTRSRQRVRDHAAISKHKGYEKGLFSSIAPIILFLLEVTL